MGFFDWLKELFNIDFLNRGKTPYDDVLGLYSDSSGSSGSSGSALDGGSLTSLSAMLKALASRLTGAALTPAEREVREPPSRAEPEEPEEPEESE